MLPQACVPMTEGYSEILIITLFLEIIRSLSSLSRLFCSGCLDTFDYVQYTHMNDVKVKGIF